MNHIIQTQKIQYVALLIVATIMVIWVMPIQAQQAQVTICHVAGHADDPANHITMTINENAVQSHFDNNGTPHAGHEGDYFGDCNPPTDEQTESETPVVVEVISENVVVATPTPVIHIPEPDYAIINMGGHIWLDADADMERDGNEPGIVAVSLSLWTLEGSLLQTVTTQPDGSYGFSEIIEGQYRVTIEPSSLPVGWEQTYEYDLSFDGNVQVDALIANQLNFGYRPNNLGGITGFVWQDSNINATLDGNEVRLSQVLVTLFADNGETMTVSTDASGYYQFDSLLGGTYTVQIIVDGQHHHRTIALPAQETWVVDFPLSNTRIISGTIWLDDNQNGRENPGERGFAGIDVQLYNEGGQLLDTQTVQANGRYIFMDVIPGVYTIRVDETTIPGSAFVTHDMDGNLTFDVTFTLTPYQNINNADFGVVSSS